MWNKPLLGGFDIKYAAAYLLPPTTIKKKKKKMPAEEETEVEKVAAALGNAIVNARLSLLRQQMRSNDLGAGQHFNNQIK
jgi:hypothetical protein